MRRRIFDYIEMNIIANGIYLLLYAMIMQELPPMVETICMLCGFLLITLLAFIWGALIYSKSVVSRLRTVSVSLCHIFSVVLVGCLVGYCEDWLMGENWLRFIQDFVLFSMASLAVSVVYFLRTSVRYEREIHEKMLAIESEANKSRLQVLQAQFSPHFFYNNLSALSSLISDNPAKAKEFVVNLSDLYRMMSIAMGKERVSISEELKMVRLYAAVLTVRFGDSINIDVDASDVEGELFPHSVQHLIENAIKHNAHTLQRPLNVKVSVGEDTITVENNLQRIDCVNTSHTGLDNLKQRYKLCGYKEPLIEETDNNYKVILPIL